MRASDRTQEVARVVVDSTGTAPVVTVEPWKGHDSDPDAPARPWRPTATMEALSRALETAGEPLSFRALDERVKGKHEHKRSALAELDAAGFITVTTGANRAKLHTHALPYRQTDDPGSDAYEPRELDGVVIWLNHDYTWDPDAMIPPCWPQHPHLVHEIAALADQRRRAGLALDSNALEEWHRYSVPTFTERMKSRLKAHCEQDHQPWPGRGRHTKHTASGHATISELFERGGDDHVTCQAAPEICRNSPGQSRIQRPS